MHPYYFGRGGRRLFGVYESAVLRAPTQRGVVLCHPWGAEYLHAHRTVRLLAKELSSQFHTLRFDYYGTGDSAGESPEGTLTQWEADIGSAINELRDTSGAESIALIGLRLGASLAATVAAKRPRDVNELVLWDPILSGAEYLERLHLVGEPASKYIVPGSTDRSVNGFPLTEVLEAELKDIDLPAVLNILEMRTLIIVTELAKGRGRSHVTDHAIRNDLVSIDRIKSVPPWIESPTGEFPVATIRRVIKWLNG